jgi:hypothetical protein
MHENQDDFEDVGAIVSRY